MARRIKNLVLWAALFTSLISPVSGQTETESTRSLDFWAYRVGNGNWTDIRFEASKGEVDTLTPGQFMKGRTHEYHGPAQLIFFRERAQPSPEDPAKVVRIPVAQTRIPSGVNEAILIFVPAKDQADSNREFDVYFVEAEDSDFPAGSMRIFNATGVRLAGKVGRESRYFDPGISEAIRLDALLDAGVPVSFLVETREGPRFVFEKDLEYALNRRVILLLEPPRRKGSYKIQATNLIERVDPH